MSFGTQIHKKKFGKNGFHTLQGTMSHRPLTNASSLKITAAYSPFYILSWPFLPAPLINNHRTAEERVNMLQSCRLAGYIILHCWTIRICMECNSDPVYHRVDTELGFFSSRLNWNPPIPHLLTRSRVCPLPFCPGGAHSPAGEGVGGVPIRMRGQTLLYSRYILFLCHTLSFFNRPAWDGGAIQIESMDAGKVTFHLKSWLFDPKIQLFSGRCFSEFIDWRYISHVDIFDPAFELLPL